MNWPSWADFFAMGGYAFYIWGTYVVTLVFIVTEVLTLFHRRRTLLEQLGLIHRTSSGKDDETST